MKGLTAVAIVVIVGVLGVASPPPAGAHLKVHRDANEADANRLDIYKSSIGHSKTRMYFGIRTYGRWKHALIRKGFTRFNTCADRRKGCGEIFFVFDVKAPYSPRGDYFVRLTRNGGRLHGKVFKSRGYPNFVGYTGVYRPDRKSLIVYLKRSLVPARRVYSGKRALRWGSYTAFKSPRICRKRCQDAAPSLKGAYRHWF